MTDDINFNLLSLTSEAVRSELPKAIAFLREKRPVYVFNRGGETVCITVDNNYAAMKAAEGFSIEEALKAEPIT